MSYSDERKGFSPASIGTVVLVHAAIGYAFISGLAYQVIQSVPIVTTAVFLPDDKAPPPNEPPPPPQARRTTSPPPVTTSTIVEVPLGRVDTVTTVDAGPLTPPIFETPVPPLPPAPAQSTHTRGAVPLGDRAAWVTTDDYPTAALREGREGSVGIDVTIDEKGRVSGCTVTASSGSELLDQATCKLYSRRARFTPALDEAGKPAVAHRADRVRWQIPS